MKKAIHYLLLAFFTVLLLFSSWKLASELLSYKEGQDSYESLEQYVSFETAATEPLPPAQTEEPVETETEEPDKTQWPKVDFVQLEAINPDVVGWIFIEGTNINYPVVQGEDNDYYLSHLLDRSSNSSGSIFLDAYCAPDFSDSHSILSCGITITYCTALRCSTKTSIVNCRCSCILHNIPSRITIIYITVRTTNKPSKITASLRITS